MLFNSFVFAAFLPIVFALYWLLRDRLRAQNTLLIAAGFVFYGWWDWRFLFLLLATSLTDFVVANAMGRTTSKASRKRLLAISLTGNLGTLAMFKYYDFFALELAKAFGASRGTMDPFLLNVLLPVGISFYTFQALSYTIDVYRRRIAPVSDLTAFMAFISFFPQLCAGPIERASHMLPQFSQKRTFDPALAADGLRQMLWGLFKKMVVADNCAHLVNEIFRTSDHQPGPVLVLGAVLFAFQIYCDFSGYTDMALGMARLFGFELMRNFAFPYFSRDMAEFWRRWHISLSTWFRDYLYIPLGGSHGKRWLKVRNTMIIFMVSGFWHGANWTFIVWGLLNGLYFLPLLLRDRNRLHLGVVAEGRMFPSFVELRGMITTFSLACIAWVFFRAATLSDAWNYVSRMFTHSFHMRNWTKTADFMSWQGKYAGALVCLLIMIVVEWWQRSNQHGLQRLPASRPVRWGIYLTVIMAIIMLGDHGQNTFIYFQF